MNSLGGLSACGDTTSLRPVGELIEEGSRHLRASGIVNASKDKDAHLPVILLGFSTGDQSRQFLSAKAAPTS
jgi:hypothetical protein